MDKWKRLIYYLMINVLVSTCTVLVVLAIWDRYNTPQVMDIATPVAASELPEATLVPTAQEVIAIPPTNTPGPSPDLSVEEYEVQFGDTLGIIAQKFDVAIEELMEVNQLDDPNSISVGLIVYIPVTPQVVPTRTSLPTQTPNPLVISGTPAPTQEARVVINSVIGVGDLTSERVFLTRTGDGELNMADWKLEDEDGNVFVFPQFTLYSSGGFIVWTTSGTATAVELYWGMGNSVWESGEKVTLRDARGRVHTTYTIP